MKKSQHYMVAMAIITESDKLETTQKLEILETLMADKRSAVWGEEREAAHNADLS